MATATQSPPNNASADTSHVQNDAARQLLRRWREEAQDETAWPEVQQLIEENRFR